MKTYPYLKWLCFVGTVLLLQGCPSDPFPVGESFQAGSDAPLIVTRTFDFKTGSGLDLSLSSNLVIASGADVKNLITASPGTEEQSGKKGVISGFVVNAFDQPLSSVAIGLRDASGEPLRDDESGAFLAGVSDENGLQVASILYGSINGVPEFVNTVGTGNSGSFTALNVPPGENYLTAIQGGRGNARVTVFAEGLSFIDLEVFPVVLPTVQITGSVSERDGLIPISQAAIYIGALGVQGESGNFISSSDSGAYNISRLVTDSLFLLRVVGDAHFDTYQKIFTNNADLNVIAVIPQITQNLKGFSNLDVQNMIQSAGATLTLGKGLVFGEVFENDGLKNELLLSAYDATGQAVGDIYYFPKGADNPGCNQSSDGNCQLETSNNGQFLIANLPAGDIYLKAHSNTASSTGPKSAGSQVVTLFADSVSMVNMSTELIQRDDGFSTAEVSGTILETDGITPVSGVSLSIVGSPESISNSDAADGSYRIEKASDPDAVFPLLTNSEHLLRLEKNPSHVTTYLPLNLGRQDLANSNPILFSKMLIGETQGLGVVVGRLINRRLGGSVADITVSATQAISEAGVMVAPTDPTNSSVGRVSYMSSLSTEDTTLSASDSSGLFMIRNLPPGLVMIKTNSSDDSGNLLIRSYADSVSVQTMRVNHVPLKVRVQGQVSDLHQNVLSEATLSLLGEQGSYSSEQLGSALGILVSSNGRFITKVTKTGFLESYNLQLRTSLRAQSGLALFLATETEVANFAIQGGLDFNVDTENVIAGEVRALRIVEASAGMSPIPTGNSPSSQAVGFFNEDAIPDIAVVHAPNQLQVFIGQSTGIFSAGDTYTVGSDPRSVRVGDFDNDGRQDLVISNRGSHSLSVFLGLGNGAFQAGSEITTGLSTATVPTPAPGFVLVVDLDADGRLDLAVANESDNTIATLMGDGKGGFSSATNALCPTPCATRGDRPVGIAATDIDNDQDLDLIVASADSGKLTRILSGEAAGNDVVAGLAPSAIVAGDLNGDGALDLVVANSGDHSLSVFQGDGTASFVKIDCLPMPELKPDPLDNCPLTSGSQPGSLNLFDFDLDGRLDIAVTDSALNTISIFTGLGDGTFESTPRQFDVGSGPISLIVADLNQDDRSDFVVLNGGEDSVTLLLSEVLPTEGVVIESKNTAGQALGEVRYLNAALDVDLTLQSTSANGRFMVFDLSEETVILRGTRPRSDPEPALIGNRILNLDGLGRLYFADMTLDIGLPAGVTLSGVTCREVGTVCSKVERIKIELSGLSSESLCDSTETCASRETDPKDKNDKNGSKYEVRLDPNSSYVVTLTAPASKLPGDLDGDGVGDPEDNCTGVSNPDQVDSNADRVGDPCAGSAPPDTSGN